MEVELALDIDQYEEYESLEGKGWGDFAYKTVYLPTVFIGLRLFIDFMTSKGEKSALNFVVVDVYYFFRDKLLAVYIEFDELPMLMADLITAENGWRKKSVHL
ncbi:MAG: hypothetical protein WAP55_02120 [Minisyncoccia bacterium]